MWILLIKNVDMLMYPCFTVVRQEKKYTAVDKLWMAVTVVNNKLWEKKWFRMA
jgi:hypothetical protein